MVVVSSGRTDRDALANTIPAIPHTASISPFPWSRERGYGGVGKQTKLTCPTTIGPEHLLGACQIADTGSFIMLASLGHREDARKALPSGPSAKTSANGSRPLIARSYQSAAWSVSPQIQ